jgi:CPA2 family monovalent cation:H+ antiporter-2
MYELLLLHDMLVIFGAALLVIALSSRLHIPPVVGFLLTGMAVGPHGLALIDDTHAAKVFAELGVVFLLYVVGLELSPNRLHRLGRVLLVGGILQTTLTMILTTGVVFLLGYSLRESLYFSFLIALSSTAIVLKLYSERREIETPHGEAVMGILLFQDFLIVPLLIVVPVLAGAGSASASEVALRFGGGLLAVGLIFGAGRYVLPYFLQLIIHTRIRELVVIGALFACLGSALITESLGFSLALGAFAAGHLIAETDYRYQVLAETAPFRDVFNSTFFIAVGMLLRLDFALDNAALILAVGGTVMAIKAIPALLAVKALSFPSRTCLIATLGLAQISEFSFVLIQAGKGYGLLDEWHYQLAIAASVLTMLLTPVWVALASPLAKKLSGADGAGAHVEELELHEPPQVVIFGFGPKGRHLARVLKLESIPYSIVDVNGRTVREARAQGEPILFGDSTRREIQEKAGIEEARIGVFAISDRTALRDNVRLARSLNPHLFIIARTRYLAEFDDLRNCGADTVVAEEFGSSAEILRSVLIHLHMPGNVIRAELHPLRQEAYPHAGPPAAVAAPATPPQAQARIDTFIVGADRGGGVETT